MTRTNIFICAGFSPSARILRAALRGISTKKDIIVISGCPAMAGLEKAQEEVKGLNPNDTLVIDGCDGCCGLQALMGMGLTPAKTLILDRYFSVSDKTIKMAEDKILKAMEEMGR